jgi:polyisoprenoid-binding protein YceI
MTATHWDFDKTHSSVNFSVRHLMVSKVRGQFHDWTGTLVLDDADITRSVVEVTIQAASIDTKEEKRDAHLKSADFFEVEKFPTLTFKSTKIEKVSAEEIKIHGDLTIHGITKPVVLVTEVSGIQKDPWGGTRTGFSAHTSIEREEFGLTWNAALEAGGVVVGKKVEITLEIEAVQKAATQAA